MNGPVGIVGAGIVGLATARQLARAGVPVTVWEKEPGVARHQTGRNSGVVHAGIYYQPGSAKAKNCRRGVELLRAYCAERDLPWDERGKLVVARNEVETGRLREIERRSQANGVPGVRWLDGPDIRALEPDVAGVAALLSPTTAITDYPGIARSFAADLTDAGGELLTGTPVMGVRRHGDGVQVRIPDGIRTVSRLVICAGLQSDLLAQAAGDEPGPEIVPFRGEYLRLRPEVKDRVRHLIYPVPDPAYPFLGVHLTPRIDGESDLGPNAVLALAREGYRWRDVSAEQLSRLARSAAFRRLARQNWRAGLREMRGSLSRAAFLAEARSYLPWLEPGHVTSAPAGVRAQAVDQDGSLVDDFRIHQIGPVTAIRNAPSPAATASMAIAEQIVARLFVTLGLPTCVFSLSCAAPVYLRACSLLIWTGARSLGQTVPQTALNPLALGCVGPDMKRNTPLITLLTGAALGVVLLVASMLQTPTKAPAGYSSTATSSPATSAPATSAPPSSSAPASVSASPTATPYAAGPAKANYAGKVNGGGATIAIVVYNGQVIAYICNGSTIDAWFSGPVSSGSKITLTGKNNATLTASYGVGEMTGDVTAHGTAFNFGVDTVSKSSGAGLYRATGKAGGDAVKAGWIVLPDGSQTGSLEADSASATPSAVRAPRLDLATRTATYQGTVLHAVPVSGVTGSGF